MRSGRPVGGAPAPQLACSGHATPDISVYAAPCVRNPSKWLHNGPKMTLKWLVMAVKGPKRVLKWLIMAIKGRKRAIMGHVNA